MNHILQGYKYEVYIWEGIGIRESIKMRADRGSQSYLAHTNLAKVGWKESFWNWIIIGRTVQWTDGNIRQPEAVNKLHLAADINDFI